MFHNSLLHPHKVKILYCLAFVLQIINSTIGFPNSSFGPHHNPLQPHNRAKRNLGQLVSLLVKDTPYNFYKMSNYGNWCGRGGDRMGDGSYIDGCDLCCKMHDECYYTARHGYPGCNPLFTLYSYRHGEEHPDVIEGMKSEEERDIRRKRNLPSCVADTNKAPSCKDSICQCDIKLAVCLKKEPCDPNMVSKKSRIWWLPG